MSAAITGVPQISLGEAAAFVGSGIIPNARVRYGYEDTHLLSLRQRSYCQEWGCAKRQAEIPL